MNRIALVAALVSGLLGVIVTPARSDDVTQADTARFLAGMPPSAGSPLEALTKSGHWRSHAKAMDTAFATVEKNTLSKIRVWSRDNVKSPQPTLLYMFGGPDFLFANAFFPDASTYLLVGLEPAGDIPDLMRMQRRGEVAGLGRLESSMRTLLAVSFFITKDMREDLGGSNLQGTIPIIYIFLARSGMEVRDASLVMIDDNGEVKPDDKKGKTSARGVKITFAGLDGRLRTFYYFTTDLANGGVQRGGFLKFAGKLGPADAFHKSASYLMHKDNFSQIRSFVLSQTKTIVQDDSGIPLRYFDQKVWDLYPFGKYHEPLEIFPEGRQSKIAREVFGKAAKIDFGLGYRWRTGESNLLMAVKKPQ
ncbi:hypothetical protein [Undibacter mobilis]|uniref:Uncharacterized protein n=1 Tax=Undibacter mobilis TaxID=2292256 RepID=A0A371BD35_9BRAD|nr:hypothetical protein [Undibacter mobilis]RDV05478.1 hypothetical protein DXH78_13395 [Undibacter mobilis]